MSASPSSSSSSFLSGQSAIARSSLAAVSQALDALVTSPEPAVVLTSVARQCVPVFADRCVVEVLDHEHGAYSIEYPVARPSQPVRMSSGQWREVQTEFRVEAYDGAPAVTGSLTHSWQQHTPGVTDAAIARMVADRAVAAITRERLSHAADQARSTISDLEVALHTNRRIGAAIGILMATLKVTDDEAFVLLRQASQRSHVKIRDVAEDVLLTGCLQ